MIGVDEFMKLFLAVALLPAWIEAKLQINIEKNSASVSAICRFSAKRS
jgi:hypothetical protein